MQISSIQTVVETLWDYIRLTRVFYTVDPRTGQQGQESISYDIKVYNSRGAEEQSKQYGNIDIRA